MNGPSVQLPWRDDALFDAHVERRASRPPCRARTPGAPSTRRQIGESKGGLARNYFRPSLVYHYSVDATDSTTTQLAVPQTSVRKFAVSRVGEKLRRHGSVFRDPAVEALAALRAHKLRSALTLLGVTLSVSVLILVVSIITGANLYIEQRVANMGSNVFLVLRFPIITNQQDFLKAMRRNRYVTWDDFEALRDGMKLPRAGWPGDANRRQSPPGDPSARQH